MISASPTLKNYYKVLDLDPSCSSDEVKHKFRQQVMLSHHDKVSHLGKPIQDLAVERTAELTEAYSVLANETRRAHYNRMLQETTDTPAADRSGAAAAPSPSASNAQDIDAEADPGAGENGRIEVSGFLHKAVLHRLRQAVQQQVPKAREVKLEGFDLAYVIQPRWSHFRSRECCARVLVRAVARGDSVVVQDVWQRALRPGDYPPGDTYLFLAGASLDTASKISTTILEQQQRNRSRSKSILLVPLNANTWEILIPSGAPDLLRAIINGIQEGSR